MQDIYFGVYHQGNFYMKNTVYPIVESTVTEAMTEAGDSGESAVLRTTAVSIEETETPHSVNETSLFPWLIGAAVLLAIVLAAVLRSSGKPKQNSPSVSASGGSGTKVFGKSAPDTQEATRVRTGERLVKPEEATMTVLHSPHLSEPGTKAVSGKKQEQPPAPEETWRKYFTLDDGSK